MIQPDQPLLPQPGGRRRERKSRGEREEEEDEEERRKKKLVGVQIENGHMFKKKQKHIGVDMFTHVGVD